MANQSLMWAEPKCRDTIYVARSRVYRQVVMALVASGTYLSVDAGYVGGPSEGSELILYQYTA